MQDETDLIGDGALARGAVGGQLGLVHLDQVLGLAADAVDVLLEMPGLSLDLRCFASVPESGGQPIGQPETALGLALQQQAAVRGNQAAVEGHRQPLAANGWNIEGKKSIVGHGGCGAFVGRVEIRLDNDFLHDFNELCHARQPIIRPDVNNPG